MITDSGQLAVRAKNLWMVERGAQNRHRIDVRARGAGTSTPAPPRGVDDGQFDARVLDLDCGRRAVRGRGDCRVPLREESVATGREAPIDLTTQLHDDFLRRKDRQSATAGASFLGEAGAPAAASASKGNEAADTATSTTPTELPAASNDNDPTEEPPSSELPPKRLRCVS